MHIFCFFVCLFAQFDACIQDLVRCVALTRLVYGMGHLNLAQAHVRLAKAYLRFKGKCNSISITSNNTFSLN